MVQQQITAIDELSSALQNYPGIQNFVDTLFSEHGIGDPHLNTAYQSLVAAVEDYPELRKPLLSVMVRFYDLAIDVVREHAPNASDAEVQAVAHGIVDLYLATDALAPLSPNTDWARASYEGALLLVRALPT